MIPWDYLQDFVDGEQDNENFLCKFNKTKEHVWSSASNTLTHPQANNASLVYKLTNDIHTPPIINHNSYKLSITFTFSPDIQCPYSLGSIVIMG
jgi:hypothetical protein